jgi:small neutral amino acid transporter SnatA (MarC family)
MGLYRILLGCGHYIRFETLYFMLMSSTKEIKWLTPMGSQLSFRPSGLIIAVLGIQMIFSGVRHEDLRVLKHLGRCDANITGNT